MQNDNWSNVEIILTLVIVNFIHDVMFIVTNTDIYRDIIRQDEITYSIFEEYCMCVYMQ